MSTASPHARILVVDDEPDLRTLYELTLLREGHAVDTAADLQTARECLRQARFDTVITDMRLPDGLGLELVKELAQSQRSERTIVITAYGSADNAVEALKSGAFDYLTKPVDLKQFRSAVAAAVHSQRRSTPAPSDSPDHDAPPAPAVNTGGPSPGGQNNPAHPALQRLVGQSAALATVKSRIERVARSMAPVLILGESGTGKELAARALHECSHRAGGPFVAVNCGAIPDTLIEAEFFGARKGAYTGSTHDREGYFQAARGGTLFLDEIGDLPVAMQAKLLRVIQERCVRPLGAVQEEPIDVRLVSATHKDLTHGVRTGAFRQDLYYRLNVIELKMPPLRERHEDLPALAEALLQRLSHEAGQPTPRIDPEALAWLQAQPLPGNVRELENLLHRALALGQADRLRLDDFCDASDIPPSAGTGQPATAEESTAQPKNPNPEAAPPTASALPRSSGPMDLQAFLDRHEKALLIETLATCGQDRPLAAQRLGLSQRQLRYRLQRLLIDKSTPPEGEQDAGD